VKVGLGSLLCTRHHRVSSRSPAGHGDGGDGSTGHGKTQHHIVKHMSVHVISLHTMGGAGIGLGVTGDGTVQQVMRISSQEILNQARTGAGDTGVTHTHGNHQSTILLTLANHKGMVGAGDGGGGNHGVGARLHNIISIRYTHIAYEYIHIFI